MIEVVTLLVNMRLWWNYGRIVHNHLIRFIIKSEESTSSPIDRDSDGVLLLFVAQSIDDVQHVVYLSASGESSRHRDDYAHNPVTV